MLNGHLCIPFRSKLRAEGFSIYREDGTEGAYSRQSILGLGMNEFEYERTWPDHYKMIGPVLFTPEPKLNLPLTKAKLNVLVTLGTHLEWAKYRLKAFVKKLSAYFPNIHFHVTLGLAQSLFESSPLRDKNYTIYPYIPYDEYIEEFDAVICHGGAGIVYHCINRQVPIVVCPLDYDQFDYARSG